MEPKKNINPEFKALLLKLKALAERGVDGEQENAREMLVKMLERHGLELEDIEGGKIYKHEFTYGREYKKLSRQIIHTVLGYDAEVYEYKKKKQVWIVNCTEAQGIEIEQKISHYVKAFKKEVEILYLAFIHKHELFAKTTCSKQEEESQLLTDEEVEKITKMLSMMQSLDNAPLYKSLT